MSEIKRGVADRVRAIAAQEKGETSWNGIERAYAMPRGTLRPLTMADEITTRTLRKIASYMGRQIVDLLPAPPCAAASASTATEDLISRAIDMGWVALGAEGEALAHRQRVFIDSVLTALRMLQAAEARAARRGEEGESQSNGG